MEVFQGGEKSTAWHLWILFARLEVGRIAHIGINSQLCACHSISNRYRRDEWRGTCLVTVSSSGSVYMGKGNPFVQSVTFSRLWPCILKMGWEQMWQETFRLICSYKWNSSNREKKKALTELAKKNVSDKIVLWMHYKSLLFCSEKRQSGVDSM